MYDKNKTGELDSVEPTVEQTVGGAAEPETMSSQPSIAPAVDIYENDAGYLVLADLPGVAVDGIDIRYEEGELSLVGRRDESARDYRRVFRIPEDVDAEGIDAALDNGVLELRLPKTKSVQPRKIAVRASA